jgi:hypothetical protein
MGMTQGDDGKSVTLVVPNVGGCDELELVRGGGADLIVEDDVAGAAAANPQRVCRYVIELGAGQHQDAQAVRAAQAMVRPALSGCSVTVPLPASIGCWMSRLSAVSATLRFAAVTPFVPDETDAQRARIGDAQRAAHICGSSDEQHVGGIDQRSVAERDDLV